MEAMEKDYKKKLVKQKAEYDEKILILNNTVNILQKHKERLERRVAELEKKLGEERDDRALLAANMGNAIVAADARHTEQVAELEEKYAQRISAQSKQIEGIAASLQSVEGYRQSLVEQVRGPHSMDYSPTRWPQSPRIVMRCAARASNGPNHVGLCALQRSELRRRLRNNVSELQKSQNETNAVRGEIEKLLLQVRLY